MMDILIDAVKRLEERVHNTGCDDGNIVLSVNPDVVQCQFENGASMEASFGGRRARFVTSDPIRATTRVGFMFGAPLEKPAQRAAAGAIINVITGFLCISRIMKACEKTCHADCLSRLSEEIRGKSIYVYGDSPRLSREFQQSIVSSPDLADILIVTGEGLVSQKEIGKIGEYGLTKKVLLVGPSTAGVSALVRYAHWCPYGRS
jgi:hypothetical protein